MHQCKNYGPRSVSQFKNDTLEFGHTSASQIVIKDATCDWIENERCMIFKKGGEVVIVYAKIIDTCQPAKFVNDTLCILVMHLQVKGSVQTQLAIGLK